MTGREPASDARQVIPLSLTRFRIVSFMVVGGIGYVVNMAAYGLLLRFFRGAETTFLGRHFYLPPFAISSLLAIVSNYALNRAWTFRDWNERSVGFLRYLSMALITLPLDMAGLWVLVDWGRLPPMLAAAIAVATMFAIRYTIARTWIWSRHSPSAS